ncbi:PREDICTED: vesicle-associated [Prunus dulcis]|uniref:PREDICTED: vesicle-associated n=1 Tax=Prunus dulcis TaxID=3755 RepID=A0A5E4EQH2_PRUDU|nr:vesicle-associated protein 2-2-like [Prunus dulcis]VVA16861.1 PREDICTED: vesicle-associated [Prunus dulcis]
MMTTELLDVQPCELKFTFELKKQSLCSIQLGNKSDHYVAFKVKTTSPKKYCVRPNAGIIKPKATCDFTVTMQAQRVTPPDLQCKDKFLILSTVIPFGTTEEEITSDMFSKDSGKYIEEKKLRVVLISPPSSPVFVPINGELKQDPCYENSVKKDRVLSGVENIPPPHGVAEDVEGFETYKDMDESRAVKDVEELKPAKDVEELKPAKVVEELKPAKVVEELKPAKDAVALNLTKDFEELKLKLNTVDSKLKEAELTIMKLTEDRSMTTREKNMLKHELELLRRKNNVKRIMVGFPLFYVCMVALISLAIGYYIHP